MRQGETREFLRLLDNEIDRVATERTKSWQTKTDWYARMYDIRGEALRELASGLPEFTADQLRAYAADAIADMKEARDALPWIHHETPPSRGSWFGRLFS